MGIEPRVPQNLTKAGISVFVVDEHAVGELDDVPIAQDGGMNFDSVLEIAVVAVVVTLNTICPVQAQNRMMPGSAVGRDPNVRVRRAPYDGFTGFKDNGTSMIFGADLFERMGALFPSSAQQVDFTRNFWVKYGH